MYVLFTSLIEQNVKKRIYNTKDENICIEKTYYKGSGLTFSKLYQLGIGKTDYDWKTFYQLFSTLRVFLVIFSVLQTSVFKMFGKAGALAVTYGNQQQVRGMATLKAISLRLKSVKNIQKITQSMKMVSAAKYTKAERDLKQARPYGEGAKSFYDKAEVAAPTENPQKLLIALTSDRGLCGAVHTQVSRQVRNEVCEDPENTKIICIGDKSRAILQRLFGKNILVVANEVGRKPPTFLDASKIAQETSNHNFSSGKIIYNRFKSVVSYTTSELPLFSQAAITAAPKITLYDSLDSEVLQSYMEFSLASLLYYAMKEGACSEQSSRMTAMDNASKNAGEMIDKLTLTFNRTRQAVITRELIEIISGAAALE